MQTISKEQAKRFLLSKQGLLGKRRFFAKEGALRFVRQAGCIQFDPVDVCGKNAELTLNARVSGFTKKTLADLLYKDRLLVDYTDKELAIWPREDWPCFARFRARSRVHGLTFPGLAELETQAVAYIREHGPVSSDTLPIEGRIVWHSSMHWSGNWHGDSPAARSVLEQLYTDGVLLIHHKSGTRKFYDLAERYFPPELLEAEDTFPQDADFLRWRLRRRIGAVGLLWNRRSDAWLGIEMDPERREAAFAEMEATGEIEAVQVEGVRSPLYLLAEDRPLLEAVLSDAVDTRPRTEFLAPLDPFLWDRKLIEAIFGFTYSWEIYTPPEKRKFGAYVLPVLRGQDFIGRIEPVVDRKTAALEVRNLWLEPGIRETQRLRTAVDAATQRLAKLNGCERVEFR